MGQRELFESHFAQSPLNDILTAASKGENFSVELLGGAILAEFTQLSELLIGLAAAVDAMQ